MWRWEKSQLCFDPYLSLLNIEKDVLIMSVIIRQWTSIVSLPNLPFPLSPNNKGICARTSFCLPLRIGVLPRLQDWIPSLSLTSLIVNHLFKLFTERHSITSIFVGLYIICRSHFHVHTQRLFPFMCVIKDKSRNAWPLTAHTLCVRCHYKVIIF